MGGSEFFYLLNQLFLPATPTLSVYPVVACQMCFTCRRVMQGYVEKKWTSLVKIEISSAVPTWVHAAFVVSVAVSADYNGRVLMQQTCRTVSVPGVFRL